MPLTPDRDSRETLKPELRSAKFNLRRSGCDVTIALVTEDAELAAASARVLAEEGYRVRTALHSGHATLAGMQGRIDVLISDMSMEEVSGPALTRRMRRHNPSMKAIYLAKSGTLCAADNVLVRPFTREDLLSAVARQLSGDDSK